jgi:hypothetical protein
LNFLHNLQDADLINVRTAKPSSNQTSRRVPLKRAVVFRFERANLSKYGEGHATENQKLPLEPKPLSMPLYLHRLLFYLYSKKHWLSAFHRMQHTITATLLDLTPLGVSDITLNLDADSWAWTFSCRLLNAEQLPLVVKSDGTAVQIITINGYSFNMLVEKVTRNRSFAKNSISLSGRSLTALLTQPYVQPANLMNVQQLVGLELPFDWEIGLWTAANWNIPAGIFSYTAKNPHSSDCRHCR